MCTYVRLASQCTNHWATNPRQKSVLPFPLISAKWYSWTFFLSLSTCVSWTSHYLQLEGNLFKNANRASACTLIYLQPRQLRTHGNTYVINPLSMALSWWRSVTGPLLTGLWQHMFGWSAKCETPVQEYHLTDTRGNGETDLCLIFATQWFVHWHTSHRSWVRSQHTV